MAREAQAREGAGRLHAKVRTFCRALVQARRWSARGRACSFRVQIPAQAASSLTGAVQSSDPALGEAKRMSLSDCTIAQVLQKVKFDTSPVYFVVIVVLI